MIGKAEQCVGSRGSGWAVRMRIVWSSIFSGVRPATKPAKLDGERGTLGTRWKV